MSIVKRSYSFDATGFLALVNDLRTLLNARDGGIQHKENVGPVLSCRYLDGRELSVLTGTNRAPVHINVTCRNRATATLESNNAIVWTWARGAIRVSSIDVSDTAEEYDVTLRLWME